MPVQPAAGNAPVEKPSVSGGYPPKQLFTKSNLIILLCSAVVVLAVSAFFIGFPGISQKNSGKNAGEFVPPINVADVKFPSEREQDQFLKNFQDAAKTNEYGTRYELLKENYSSILGFYSADHDPKTRQVAQQYSQYMITNFPEHAKESLYTVPCYDVGCGKANYPEEIKKVQQEIDASSELNNDQKKQMDNFFEEAALSDSKNSQWSSYVNSLSVLKSAYDQNKSDFLKSTYNELADFVGKNYPDYKIPPQTRIEQ